MNLLRPRLALAWVIGLLVLAAAVWLARGPFLLERRVEIDLSIAGAKDRWSLEWLDKDGKPKNGLWLNLLPLEGRVKTRLESPIPNYSFNTLQLKWADMPGVQITDPPAVTLVDRVLWWTTRTELPRREALDSGVALSDGVHTATAPDGTIGWAMPVFTAAMAVDVLALYAVFLLGWFVVFAAYHLKDGRPWYTPDRAALAVVVGVHVWLILRAPLLYCPDSMDYLVNTKLLVENRTFDHFSTWRLPGYSVFLSPMVGGLHRFNFAVGLTQGVLAILGAWLAGRVVGRFLPGAWGALTLLLVGLDPVLMTYERHAMPETLCAFLTVLLSWIAVRGNFWSKAGFIPSGAAAIGTGLILAAACYVRGNMMVVAGAIPFIIAVWSFLDGNWRRALSLALLCGLTTAACLAPWVMRMKREYGRTEFVVGTGYTRCISLADTFLVDLNQTAVYGQERWEWLAGQRANGLMAGQQVMGQTGLKEGTQVSKQIEGMHSWTARDTAAAVIANETVARHPTTRWAECLRAFSNMIALWPFEPVWYDNEAWSRPLRGVKDPGLNHRVKPPAFKHHKLENSQDIYDRTIESTLDWSRSDQAGAFLKIWQLAEAARPLWAVLVIIGTICAVSRRQWPVAMLGLMVLGHAGVMAVHLLSGIDRYQVPMYPIMTVLAVYGVACLASRAPMAAWGPKSLEPRDSGTRLDR